MTEPEGAHRPAGEQAGGVGDESQNEVEIVTGIPSGTQPRIPIQTYIDPYPARQSALADVRESVKKPGRQLKARGGQVHVVKKVVLRLGSAASFKRQLDRILETASDLRPGVPIRQILAEMLVDAALGGDKWAFEQVLDRTEGKPAQTLDINKKQVSALADLPDEVLEGLRAMAARKVGSGAGGDSGGEMLGNPSRSEKPVESLGVGPDGEDSQRGAIPPEDPRDEHRQETPRLPDPQACGEQELSV